MKVLLLMLAHLLTTVAKLLGTGGAKAIVADSLLMKQQLLIINRSRRRAPNLTPVDRMLLGFWSQFLSPHHVQRAAVILKPTTPFGANNGTITFKLLLDNRNSAYRQAVRDNLLSHRLN